MKRMADIDAKRNLRKEYQRIRKRHKAALVERVARIVLGPSVMRVFAEGTREKLCPVLAKTDVHKLRSVRNQHAFSEWFDRNVEIVWRTIMTLNRDRNSIWPGWKWGHSTKIMALFARDMVLCTHYYSRRDSERLAPFLYVPVDGIVMKRLKKLKVRLPYSRIREIDTRAKFYSVQNLLGEAASSVGVPRVWFDDNWATVDNDGPR